MSVIRSLIIDTEVQVLVIVVIKILGDAGSGVGQVGEHAEDLDQHLFPGGWLVVYCLLLSVLPRIIPAGWHPQYLAE